MATLLVRAVGPAQFCEVPASLRKRAARLVASSRATHTGAGAGAGVGAGAGAGAGGVPSPVPATREVSLDTPLYDSVVDEDASGRHKMAIVYENHRAYPAYLLTFAATAAGDNPFASGTGNPFASGAS